MLEVYLAGLALVDSLNPVILGLCIALLLRSQSVLNASGFAIGVFVSSLASGGVVVFGLASLIGFFIDRHEIGIALLTIIMGIACVVFGFFAPSLLKLKSKNKSSNDTFIAGVLLGLFAIQIDFITLTPFLTAMQLIASSGRDLTENLALLLWYNTVMILPLLMLIVIRRQELLTQSDRIHRFNCWIDQRAAKIIRYVSIPLGTAIVGYGVSRIVFVQ